MKRNKIRSYLTKVTEAAFRTVVDWFFPPRCPVCDGLTGEGERNIHRKCLSALYPVAEPVCLHCGRPVLSAQAEYCGHCRKKRPLYRQGKALLEYKGPVKQSMYRLKYGNRREYTAFYAACTAAEYGRWVRSCRIECIIPVPMYSGKQKVRGYNQAESFAKALSKDLQIPVEKKLIFRKRETGVLKLMNEQQRKKTLKGAFQADGGLLKKKGYRHILIVDDIYTTGSTVNEMTKTIIEEAEKQNLAKPYVYVLTICTPERLT